MVAKRKKLFAWDRTGPALAALAAVLWLAPEPARAQPPQTLQSGLHYFMVQDLRTGLAVQRGVAGSAGIAFDQIILAPNAPYRFWILQASTLTLDDPSWVTPSSGRTFEVPPFNLRHSLSPDTDGDGLTDEMEFILGSNPGDQDSDNDGVFDGPEVVQGLNPVDGFITRTGIIASAATPASAWDIAAQDNMAIVACRGAGVVIFNVFNGMNPVIVAQVNTPGDAIAVAGAGRLVAVADGNAGLAIIDITKPALAGIAHQVILGGSAQAVAVVAGVAYVGLSTGQLVSVDMTSGTVLDRLTLYGPVQDLALAGDTLFAASSRKLYSIPLFGEGSIRARGSISISGNGPGSNRWRLFAGGDLAYVTHGIGYNTYNIGNPLSPALIAPGGTAEFGWKQTVTNGADVGVAAVGPTPGESVGSDIKIYDVSDPTKTNQFLVEYATPGSATALTIYNGLAYVADGSAGLQVVNYRSADTLGVPPTISLSANFPLVNAEIEEGKLARVTAEVGDDVQVRNVEFYMDGTRVATDGNFPFEHRFITRRRTNGAGFTLRARVFDTGGSSTWTDEIHVVLLPDATPPVVRGVSPDTNTGSAPISTVAAYFSEPIDPATLSASGLEVFSAGADSLPGNGDDVKLTGGQLSTLEQLNAVLLTFPQPLAAGLYHARARSPLADNSGNALASPYGWNFRIFSEADQDGDGIPDSLEGPLALSTLNPDTNNNGVPDGLEDFDFDGLTNGQEVFLGTNPASNDTDADTIKDNNEDPDLDGLLNTDEFLYGTNPFIADTDEDTWPDEAEVTGGSDPLDELSRPKLFFTAKPPLALVVPSTSGIGSATLNTVIAGPPVAVVVPSFESGSVLALGSVVAGPPVRLVIPDAQIAVGFGATVALPPVGVILLDQSAGSGSTNPPGMTLGKPPVSVMIQP